MKVIDLVKFSGEMLKRLHENGINVEDYELLPMLADYERMKGEGGKTTYAVAVLAEKYGLSERKIYKVLARMQKDCRIGSAG